MYYRGAAAAIVVYDITSQASFARAKTWVRELQRQGNANLVMALAGNKSDMSEMRQVSVEEAAAYAEENGLHFVETSAKTAASVNDLFCDVARKLPRDAPAAASAPGVVLDARRNEKPKSQCC
jgi:GTPase SAR1 family protein